MLRPGINKQEQDSGYLFGNHPKRKKNEQLQACIIYQIWSRHLDNISGLYLMVFSLWEIKMSKGLHSL